MFELSILATICSNAFEDGTVILGHPATKPSVANMKVIA
jgi:hypothetical protein